MKKGFISLLIFGLYYLNPHSNIRAATLSQTINVDFANIVGPVTSRASGYLGSDITDSSPSDTVFNNYWKPVNLQLFSWIRAKSDRNGGYTFPGLNRAISLNAYYQVKIYHDPGDLSLGINSPWGREVAALTQAAAATGYPKIQLDILNEPDWSGYWPFTGNINDPRILEAWRVAYMAAKSVNPNIYLVGPNVNGSNIPWLKNTFLPTMKAEGRLPDILSWHEINTPIGNIAANINSMRTFLTQNGMTQVKDISINEYNFNNTHLQPGLAVQFISQLEKGKVQSASRACWEEVSGGSYDCAPHINGLLDVNGNPRAVWWVYKTYADMTGNIVNSVETSPYAAIASKNALSGAYKVLVGSIGTENTLAVKMTNLVNSNFNIKVEKIPNSGSSPLASPTIVQNYNATPVNGILEVIITGVTQHQAYSVVLTTTGNPATPTPTPTPNLLNGDINNDKIINVLDYILLSKSYGTANQEADLNDDGIVNILDYNILGANFGRYI